jgi:hypothetical protein
MLIFCDIPAWRAGTNRPVQYGRESANISWTASCYQLLVTAWGEDKIFKEENISEVWDKPATEDSTWSKQ